MVANNPLIQFQQQQGEQAIARGAAARGLNQSGGTLKDLSRFNQGLASTGIQNFVLNPLFQLAGFGPQAAAQAGGAIGNNANNLSNITMGAGNARASAFQNAGNIVGNLGSDLANLAMLRRGNTTSNKLTFSPSSSVNTGVPGSTF
jgi:C4-dicarboxylate transporter